MNKTVLIGRVCKDIELKFLPGNGTAVASFTIAIDRRFKKENGEKETDFIPIVIFGKQAESTATYSGKGKLIGISGRIQTRNYTNKESNKVYVTEVIAEEVQFLEWNKKEENTQSPQSSSGSGNGFTPVDDGEIPF